MICKYNNKKIFLVFLVFCSLFIYGKVCNAQGGGSGITLGGGTDWTAILTKAPSTEKGIFQSIVTTVTKWGENFAKLAERLGLEKAGSKALQSAIYNALQTIAMDTATWIGSGGEGQKPLFIREGWGEYLTNIADNSAGYFIESLNKKWGVSLCTPSLAVKTKIGLGLIQYVKPEKPACTFSQMQQNWDQELQRPDFLSRFQTMFDPTGNELVQALILHSDMIQEINVKKELGEKARVETKGWLDLSDIANKKLSPPGTAEKRLEFALDNYGKHLGEFTGYALIDAAQVFLNQLAITLFNNLIANLGKDKPTYTSPYAGNYGGYEAGPSTGGAAGVKEKTRKLAETQFNVRGDYNILAELTQCPNPTKAGPTNCVIDDKFRQAISEKITVGEAMKQGYLNANGIFGFTADGLEPAYNEGYPYRSMIILRKFRIVPVGWEIASQYIKTNPNSIDGTKNLGDLVACFANNDDYPGYYSAWCEGLVDPTWVLKASLNYCKREGPGPEILSEQVTGSGEESELSISRNDNYCADEQSCIKENDDGSCVAYGYCTEERRKWQFNGKSCEPKYNTCQTFRSSDGKTVSYLENTLDWSNCSVDNAGCKWYCEDYDYSAGDWDCDLTSGAKLYLDNGAEECDASSEGCHEFLRTKPGLGANLLPNSSFEKIGLIDAVDDNIADTFDFWGLIGEAVSGGYDGSTALKLTADFSQPIIIGPASYSVAGQTYTLSFYAKDCGTSGVFGLDTNTTAMETSSNWQYFKLTNIYEESASGNSVNIKINGFGLSGCIIDAVKLEAGDGASYDDYRSSGLVYEKLLPQYLESACYNNAGAGDYTFKSTAPAECDNFARKCNASEAGCELYTSQTDGAAIPARVIAQDYCPAECVGYDVFIQKETVFDSLRDAYFIPQTAKSCGAEAVGCDEFTNLDEVARGGEGREDYTYLKQCIKPSPTACADFYTWEGSDETGYQLRTFSLKEDIADANGDLIFTDPYLTNTGGYNDQFCASAADYNLSTNPDCREFYTTGGDVFYRFYPYTVTCSDNCKPYRRTENNIEPGITDQGSCGAGFLCSVADGQQYCWDASQNACYFCASGGKWDSGHFACLYDAIPGEGQTCSESQVGCREYTGNTGNNTRIILNNNFEGSAQGWIGINGAAVNTNSTSLMAGGNSLFVSGGVFQASTTLGQLLSRGNSYVLSFIAKADLAAVNLTAEFDSGATTISFSGSAGLTSSDWQIYKLNLAVLDHVVTNSESLVITGDGNFYIDDIKLTEISDRYYLIKNSWQTPDACFQDIYGNPVGALYNLGCDSYQDRDSNTHYLHSFNKLCQDSAVGCELMIDTHNSADYNSAIWNDINPQNNACDVSEPDCVYTPADNYTYAVYDQNKECAAESKGCERLGDYYKYGTDLAFSDVYLENNPDKYDEILCDEGAVGCEEWTTAEGASYFKDPGDQVCEWRQEYGKAASSWAWYKKKVKKCDTDADGYGDGILCSADSDCLSGETCKDTADTPCPTYAFKTFGYGGTGNIVNQPTIDLNNDYWAGICSASASGCGEYIDPVAKFSANLVFNADFSQDVDGDSIADGWSAAASGIQDIDIEPNTLYILAVEDVNDATLTVGSGNIYELNNTNNLSSVISITVSSIAAGGRTSKIFYTSIGASGAVITVSNASVAGNDSKVEVKKAIIDYELKGELDKTTCNGVVNFEDGCVLFNERAQSGSFLATLSWDADLTVNDGAGSSPLAGAAAERDSNVLLKVSPDRVCDKWLACRSMVAMKKESGEEENVCFDIGLCDGADDNGNCNNFILEKKIAGSPIEQTVSLPGGAASYANAAGYVKIGLDGIAENTMKGDYSLGAMKQAGELAYLPNGNFEIAGENGYPIGWVWEGGVWDSSKFRIINNPYTAQVEGIGYAPEGRNFLKIGTAASSTSEFADVIGNTDYILTAYVNTINLATGTAKVMLEQFDSNGLFISGADFISYSSGNDWGFQLAKFTTAPNASRIKVILYADSTTVGNFYFDDIKLRPALNSRTAWYTPQSCRLYPEQSSLACEYYDDSGIYRKGWHGYCLEYDRSPGSSDACVLWWPVDKVKGEGIEEGAGYIGKIPVYYCLDSSRVVTTTGNANEISRTVFQTGSRGSWGNVDNCDGNGRYTCSCPTTLSSYGINNFTPPLPIGKFFYQTIFDDVTDPNYPDPGGDYWYKVTCELEITTDLYCTKIVQTVSSAGQNKFWSGRVYEGSNYSISCNNIANITNLNQICDYSSDDAPFGSIVTPSPDSNPYEWDSDSSQLNPQPLWYGYAGSLYEESVRMGQKHIVDNVKRIFAQSYGGWEWIGDETNGRYTATSTLDWGPPTNLCNGTGLAPRPAYPNDYCAILPAISNIKVNGNNAAGVALTKNQFVNFTFNTDVDSQQMPMVMYAIDWGDNEKTVVSGVEMRARPNADNPHSLYHLYSYWDLKGKAASGTYGVDHWIDCTTTPGECRIKPKVQIKDNWGWCNGGSFMNDCSQWDEFASWVVVKEK